MGMLQTPREGPNGLRRVPSFVSLCEGVTERESERRSERESERAGQPTDYQMFDSSCGRCGDDYKNSIIFLSN